MIWKGLEGFGNRRKSKAVSELFFAEGSAEWDIIDEFGRIPRWEGRGGLGMWVMSRTLVEGVVAFSAPARVISAPRRTA